jgi:hypothetical protein
MNPLAAHTVATIHPMFRRSVVQILAQHTIRKATGGRPRKFKNKFLGSGFIIHRKVDENNFLVMICRYIVAIKKHGQQLVVRLPSTTLDLDANEHEKLYNVEIDIQVVSVRVPPEIQIPVTNFI